MNLPHKEKGEIEGFRRELNSIPGNNSENTYSMSAVGKRMNQQVQGRLQSSQGRGLSSSSGNPHTEKHPIRPTYW